MIKKIQQDFSYYSHEFKDNYRKGVHRLRTILASRAQAQAFVSNAGGARLRDGNAGQERTGAVCAACGFAVYRRCGADVSRKHLRGRRGKS